MEKLTHKQRLENLGVEKLLSIYQETYDLGKTAFKLDISLETLRKFFIENNISYKKRIIYQCQDDFFSYDNELAFYWAGFLAADGSVEKSKPRIYLRLATKDKDHVLKFKNDLQFDGHIFYQDREEHREGFKQEKYYSSGIRVTSKQIANDLLKFNITPSKSKTYQFPQHLKNNPNIRHFIR